MSMIRMEFTGQETVSRAQRLLAGIPNGITTASKSAAQRAASYMKTNSTKAIRERYAIPAADVKANERVTVSYSYANGVQVFIKFAGKKKMWHWHSEAFRKRSHKVLSIDDIRSYYGSTEVETHKRKRLEA